VKLHAASQPRRCNMRRNPKAHCETANMGAPAKGGDCTRQPPADKLTATLLRLPGPGLVQRPIIRTGYAPRGGKLGPGCPLHQEEVLWVASGQELVDCWGLKGHLLPQNTLGKVEGFAPHLFRWVCGGRGPCRPQQSTISGPGPEKQPKIDGAPAGPLPAPCPRRLCLANFPALGP
jgi:hypothetical protein